MWFFNKRQNSPLVIAVYNGICWRAMAFRFEGGHSHAAKPVEVASANGRQLPKQIIEYALAEDAVRIRVMATGDIHLLGMELPEDAADEEIHTAVAYEAADEIGNDAQMLRLAVVRADYYRMGADADAVLTSGFELKILDKFNHDCEKNGLDFEGIGSLEMAVLARHAREDENKRLLFLRKDNAFYVTPAADINPFMVSILPIGFNLEKDIAARERAERGLQRIEPHNNIPLRIVSCCPMPSAKRLWLEKSLANKTDFEIVDFGMVETDILNHAAWANVGGVESGCAFVSTPPEARSQYRVGTIIALAIFLVAVAWCGFKWHIFKRDYKSAEDKMQAWATLESEREKKSEMLISLLSKRQKLNEKKDLLKNHKALPKGLLKTLKVLSESMPKYSFVTEISHSGEESLLISGMTRWQEGLSLLDSALKSALRKDGMDREFEGLEAIAGARAQKFKFIVKPLKEKR